MSLQGALGLGGAQEQGLCAGLCEDADDLGIQPVEFHGEYDTARMQNQITSGRQEVDMTTQYLTHAPFDAISLVGFAHCFPHGEPNPGRRIGIGMGREEPAHEGRLALAAGLIGPLVVCMTTKAKG